MIAFLMVAVIVILAGVGFFIAYGANQRKRAGQSGQAEVNTQVTHADRPSVGRPTGIN